MILLTFNVLATPSCVNLENSVENSHKNVQLNLSVINLLRFILLLAQTNCRCYRFYLNNVRWKLP